MRKALLMGMALLIGSPAVVRAQDACPAGNHPAKATKIQAAMVPAFTPCDEPNATTEGNVPSCKPTGPQSIIAGGWGYGPFGICSSPDGQVCTSDTDCFFSASDGDFPPYRCDFSVDPTRGGVRWGAAIHWSLVGTPVEAKVTVKIKGVYDLAGPAESMGSFRVLVRATLHDAGGATTIDWPVEMPVQLRGGKASVKSSLSALSAAEGLPLPRCTTLEVLDAALLDPTGAPFAVTGVYLP